MDKDGYSSKIGRDGWIFFKNRKSWMDIIDGYSKNLGKIEGYFTKHREDGWIQMDILNKFGKLERKKKSSKYMDMCMKDVSQAAA